MNRRPTRQVITTLGFVLTMAAMGSQAASIDYSFSTGTVAVGSNAQIAALLGDNATVSGSFTYDTANYNPPAVLPLPWVISPREVVLDWQDAPLWQEARRLVA